MQSIGSMKLQGALLGLGVLALTAATVIAAQAGEQLPQTATLGTAATSDSAGAQLLTKPEIFILEADTSIGGLSGLDKAALSGVVAAIQDSEPLLVSVTEIGATADGNLDMASAVRDWLLAHGAAGTEVTVAGREQIGTAAGYSTHDGRVQISLVE